MSDARGNLNYLVCCIWLLAVLHELNTSTDVDFFFLPIYQAVDDAVLIQKVFRIKMLLITVVSKRCKGKLHAPPKL